MGEADTSTSIYISQSDIYAISTSNSEYIPLRSYNLNSESYIDTLQDNIFRVGQSAQEIYPTFISTTDLSANIKIGTDTLSNVKVIRVVDADNTSKYDIFTLTNKG